MSLLLLVIPLTQALADTEFLVRYSANTYVKNEHAGGLSDTYYGHLGMKGAERYGTNGSTYPSYSRITYVLDGKNNRFY